MFIYKYVIYTVRKDVFCYTVKCVVTFLCLLLLLWPLSKILFRGSTTFGILSVNFTITELILLIFWTHQYPSAKVWGVRLWSLDNFKNPTCFQVKWNPCYHPEQIKVEYLLLLWEVFGSIPTHVITHITSH